MCYDVLVLDLLDQLAALPDPEVPITSRVADAIEHSARYLASDAALRSVDVDPYWPKWDAPWWHALALFEIGEARRIPERLAQALADRVDALPSRELSSAPEAMCHCAIGCLAQVLAACGVTERAWFQPWCARYQMADGGLNCDETAYAVAGECPSSMVGTIAPFEAMMHRDPAFAARAAAFLRLRRLVDGSPTRHNAEERDAAPAWLLPTFPRFYFYDVLRGLAALVAYGEPIAAGVVEPAVTHLARAFPDGVVRVRRQAWAAVGNWLPGTLQRVPTASRFPLLDATGALGEPNAFLTRQWTAVRRGLRALVQA